MKDFNPKWVVVAVVVASALILGAQYVLAEEPASNDVACERALDGTGLANKIMVYLADKGKLNEGDVSLFYRASEHHKHCLEVAYATCGCNSGFSCPPASTTAIEGCAEVFDYEYRETSNGQMIESSRAGHLEAKVTRFESEAIQPGVHYVAFDIPIDIFNPERSSISIATADDAVPPTIPALNGAGDVLYVRAGSFEVDGKYKCKPVWLDSIDQHNMSAEDVWEQRSTNGAKRGDVVALKEVANCEAFANQAFVITVRMSVEHPSE